MFVHFLNDQIISLYGLRQRAQPSLIKAADSALRLTLTLDPAGVKLPTVDLVQSSVVQHLSCLQPLIEHDLLHFVGSTTDARELVARKRRHFQRTSVHSEWSSAQARERVERYEPWLERRALNTTLTMKSEWHRATEAMEDTDSAILGNFPALQLRQISEMTGNPKQVAAATHELQELPDRLGSHAFLNSVIGELGLLRIAAPQGELDARLEMSLAYVWLKAHVYEYGGKYIARSPGIGWVDCGLRFDPSAESILLDEWAETLRYATLLDKTSGASIEVIAAAIRTTEYRLLLHLVLLPIYRLRCRLSLPGDSNALPMLKSLNLPASAEKDTLLERVERVADHISSWRSHPPSSEDKDHMERYPM